MDDLRIVERDEGSYGDHEDVGLVQEMLRRFGYLTVPYQRGAFKEETARAVRRRGGACWVRQIASC